MSEILAHLANMAPYMLTALPAIVLSRVIAVGLMRKKNRKTTVWREAGLCLFFMFLVGLASQTVIPKLDLGGGTISVLNGNLRGELNLIPGKVFADIWRECVLNGYWTYFGINFIGNAALFVPIGFCIPLFWRDVSFRKVVLIALGISLFIELCQYPQARGTDIDDLWINTLGAAAGYGIYAPFKKHDLRFLNRFHVVDP